MTNRILNRVAGLFCFAVFVFVAASPCRAQDPQPKATAAGAAPPSESVVTVAGLLGANGGSAFQTQLDASTDEKTATAVIGWKDGTSVYALTFKGPLSAKTKEAAPLTLDGLGNGASLQVAANHLFWRGPDDDEQAESDKICDRLFPPSGGVPCDYQKMPFGEDRARYAKIQHLKDIPWYLGFSGGASVVKYAFLQETTLKEGSDTKTAFALTARGGVFRPMFGFLLGSIGYQQTSEAGDDPVTVCQPLTGTNATTCSDAVLKPPKETRGAVASFQLRRKIVGDVAIAPIVQRDLKKNATSVQIPVYFLKDAKGSPIGGVRASWRSDTKAVAMSLFVGAAFSLAP